MSGPSYSKVPVLSGKECGQPTANGTTGLWSRLTFTWLSDLFALGNLRPLDQTDLFKAVDQQTSQDISDKFQQLWEEQRRTASHPRVWKSLARLLSAGDYAFYMLTLVLISCLRISQPIFLNFLLRELARDSSSIAWLSFHIAGMCLGAIVTPFLKSSFYYGAMVFGTHMSTAITTAVYRKVSNQKMWAGAGRAYWRYGFSIRSVEVNRFPNYVRCSKYESKFSHNRKAWKQKRKS